MSQKKNPKELTKNPPMSSDTTASIVPGCETQSAELSGTPALDRYYETGELPEDGAMKELFLIMKEKGEI